MDRTKIPAGRIVIVQIIYRDDCGFYCQVERELDDAIITARQLLLEGRDVHLNVNREYESAFDLIMREQVRARRPEIL